MNINDIDFPVAIAHRGVSSIFPENTLPAFEAALNMGCKIIELDVGATKDGDFAIIHDSTLERTTNGFGRVRDNSSLEIKKLNAAAKFGKENIYTKIPMIEDVLDLVKDKAVLNIEVKSEVFKKGIDENSYESDLIKIVKEKNMTEQVIFSSFNYNVLLRLRRLDKDINIGILTSGEPRPPVSMTRKLDAYSWHPGHVNLSGKIIKYYKKHTGKRVIPYTINSYKKANRLIKAGIDGFFTDYPQKFIKFN